MCVRLYFESFFSTLSAYSFLRSSFAVCVYVVCFHLIRSLVVATNINYSFIALFVFFYPNVRRWNAYVINIPLSVAGAAFLFFSLFFLFCIVCPIEYCINLKFRQVCWGLSECCCFGGMCASERLSARFDTGGHRQYEWLCHSWAVWCTLHAYLLSIAIGRCTSTTINLWALVMCAYMYAYTYSNIPFPGHVNAVAICHFSALVLQNSQINQAEVSNNKQ